VESNERRRIGRVKPWQAALAISADVSKRQRALNSSFAKQNTRPAPADVLRFFFRRGSAKVFVKTTDIDPEIWRATFGTDYKNFEYYRLIEDTVQTGFTYRYLVLFDLEERPIALQPLIIADQDLAMAISGRVGRAIESIRARLPLFLYSRMLMAGCLVGDGKFGILPGVDLSFASHLLAEALQQFARSEAISLVTIKDFSPSLRSNLRPLVRGGYTRVDGFPSLHLDLNFSSVEDYMRQCLSRVTRKNFKRKLKKTAAVIPRIELEVRNDCSEMIDEIYPLYLNVAQRSDVTFEVFTKEYFLEASRRMPERVRYFVWRQNGKTIAFSFCTIWGDTIYDNEIGLNYAVAHELNLYYLTFHDTLDWALRNHLRFYETGPFDYQVKLHLGLCPDRLDLYIRHRSPVINLLLKFVAPVFAPAKSDPALRKYFRVHNSA
jgi:hypothetical protein